MKKWLWMFVAMFALVACNDEDNAKGVAVDNTKQEVETEQAATERSVGFEIADGNIEEATNVPENVKADILAAFNEYITAFNERDLERFKQTVSKKENESYYTESMAAAEQVFSQYSTINRQTTDVTIIKYDEKEAQVYSNVAAKLVEAGTDITIEDSARQVVVFMLEDGAWKVISVHSMSSNHP